MPVTRTRALMAGYVLLVVGLTAGYLMWPAAHAPLWG